MLVAHISDLHAPDLSRLQALWAGLERPGKRLFGASSWVFKRGSIHKPAVLDALEFDMQAMGVEHTCITGDLSNLGLKKEFQSVAKRLSAIPENNKISVVPGNHDAYVSSSLDDFTEYFSPWIGSKFPYIHQHNNVAFIGLSTAISTGFKNSTGLLGSEQLEDLEANLQNLGEKNITRVVMLHHPPQEGAAKKSKSLIDAAEFRDVIKRVGAELVLHGHMHRPMYANIQGADRKITHVFGVGSASQSRTVGDKTTAHYHLFNIKEDGSISVQQRHFDPENNSFNGDDTLDLDL